jgi:hypothetical protein
METKHNSLIPSFHFAFYLFHTLHMWLVSHVCLFCMFKIFKFFNIKLFLHNKVSPHKDVMCHNPSLGLVTKAKGLQGCGPKLSLEVAFLCPRECKRMWRERTLTLPSEFPCWELESRWIPDCSENDYKGQNPMVWWIPYTIEKLLKLKCPKWARITHLDI